MVVAADNGDIAGVYGVPRWRVGGSGEYGVSTVNDESTFCYLWKVPQKPRLGTVPLPPVTPSDDAWSLGAFYGGGSGDYDGDDVEDEDRGNDDFPAKEAEDSTSLAAAKPQNIENNARLEVRFFFTPPGIVLYTNGIDNSQAAQLPRVLGAATTDLGIPRRRPCVSPRSARY